MNRITRIASAATVLGIGAALLAGCPQDEKGLGDAPAAQVDDAAIPVWPGPDTFMNVGAYCIGENGVYIHTREASPVVIKDDANCDPGGVLAGVRPASAADVEAAEVVDPGDEG